MTLTQTTTHRAWLTWMICSLFVLTQVALQTSTGVMISALKTDFHLNLTQLGFLGSVFFYSYILMQIPAGILVDRYGPPRIFFWSVLFTACICAGYALSQNYAELLIWRLLMGISCAPAICLALTVCAQQFPVALFAIITGLTESLAMLGGLLGEEALGYATHSAIGWRGGFTIITAMLVILLISHRFLLRNNKRASHASPKVTADNTVGTSQFLAIIRQKETLLCGLYAALTFAMVIVFASLWGLPFLKISYHLSESEATHGCSLIFLGLALGMPIVGVLDKKKINRYVLMIAANVLAATLMLVIISTFHAITTHMLYGLLFILGLISSSYILPFVLIKELMPSRQQGTALGFINMMCFVIGALILQPLSGMMLERLGETSAYSYQLALMPLVACFSIAAIVAYCLQYLHTFKTSALEGA